ncbi:MAG: leucine-rich repeat domain-containing protein [Treponema sp.]|nr:leucine-rich repeat domain-containing protein [Treponema sp.]
MKATKIIAVLAVALVAGTMGLTSCSKGNGDGKGSSAAKKGKGKSVVLAESDFEVKFTEDESGVCISNYKGEYSDYKKYGENPIDEAVFPSTVQGLPVKAIRWSYVFAKSIVIPEGVEAICKFWPGTSSVTLPSTLKGIGDECFEGAKNLKEINLPEGLLWIGCNAFSKSGLTSVTLPKSLRVIGYSGSNVGSGAFYGCDSLEEINIPDGIELSGQYMWNKGDEKPLSECFSGEKIESSLALQKLLKEHKIKFMGNSETDKLEDEIFTKNGL